MMRIGLWSVTVIKDASVLLAKTERTESIYVPFLQSLALGRDVPGKFCWLGHYYRDH